MENLPRDQFNNILSKGQNTHTYFAKDSEGTVITCDGTFKEVKLPENVVCNNVLIQIVDGTITSYGESSNLGFHHADVLNSTPANSEYTDHTGGFSMSIRKENGDSLGYIRADSGKIAVKLLY